MVACSNPSTKIIGHWKAEKYEYFGEQEYDDEVLAEGKRIALSYEYTFNEDGSCVFDDFLKQPRQGIWKINGDSLIVEIENLMYHGQAPEGPENRKTQRISEFIISLNNTEMVLLMNDTDKMFYQKQ
jgi:hypothetical protein